jgi:hypothetical protein
MLVVLELLTKVTLVVVEVTIPLMVEQLALAVAEEREQ